MEKLVSVIVPVHNSSKYLNNCLDSILRQTYKKVEIIVVENGSTDNSLELLKNYKDKIRLVVLENAGLSIARNKGLELAQGEYITFVDSDDFIEDDMIEKLVESLEINDGDVSICDILEIYEDSGKHIERNEYPSGVIFKYEIIDHLVNFNYAIWNKLYKKEIIVKNNIDFPIGLKYEDIPFVLKYLANSKAASKVDGCLYNYLIHSSSEQTTVDKRVFDIIKIMDLCLDYLGQEVLEDVYIRELTTYMLKMKYVKDTILRKSFIDSVFANLEERYPNWKRSKYICSLSFIKRTIIRCKFFVKLYTSLYLML